MGIKIISTIINIIVLMNKARLLVKKCNDYMLVTIIKQCYFLSAQSNLPISNIYLFMEKWGINLNNNFYMKNISQNPFLYIKHDYKDIHKKIINIAMKFEQDEIIKPSIMLMEKYGSDTVKSDISNNFLDKANNFYTYYRKIKDTKILESILKEVEKGEI